MLFLIYINDLPDSLLSCFKLFTDDTKLYRVVSTQYDKQELQSDLQKVMDWSEEWKLAFNREKCSVLQLGRNNAKNVYTFNSGRKSMVLNITSKERDLDIIIDTELDFGKHIFQIVGKANRQLGLIKRCFIIRDRQSLLLLYKSTVRPILEYGSVVSLKEEIRQKYRTNSTQVYQADL